MGFVKTLGILEFLAAAGLVLPAALGIAPVLVPAAVCWILLMAGAKRLSAWMARLLDGQVRMMTEGRGLSNAEAERELGWQLRHPSWRQGFKA